MKNTAQATRKPRARFCVRIAVLFCVPGMLLLTTHATEPQETPAPTRPALAMLAKIAAAGASGQFDAAEQFFAQGKEAGLSPLQMYEAVLNLLPYVGYPRTLSTMSRFQKVYPQYIQDRSAGKDPQPTEPWREYAVEEWGKRGVQIQQQLGVGGPGKEEFTRQITLLSPELAEWVRYDDFGRVFGRAGLSLLEREAIVMGVLIAQAAPQLATHYRAMLRVGGSDELVETVLTAVSGIAGEQAIAASRRYITEARTQ
jgi:alkylhydroperoxidase/carboxymuconolactone decarboxylase family protein YurZ